MPRSTRTAFALSALLPTMAFACSCFGPDNFCASVDPGAYFAPDAVVLAVKQVDVAYGMHVKIVRSFSGPLDADDVITVWGDCGALCRWYTAAWSVGDTVLFALQETDLVGNTICGTSYEQPQDYMISICGVYWLGYSNGMISGHLFPGQGTTTLTTAQFAVELAGCLAGTTGIDEAAIDPLRITYRDGLPTLRMSVTSPVALTIRDASGRSTLERSWDGAPLDVADLAPGIYLVEVRGGRERIARKVVVGR